MMAFSFSAQAIARRTAIFLCAPALLIPALAYGQSREQRDEAETSRRGGSCSEIAEFSDSGFQEFFEAFVRSPAVRRKYSASTIELRGVSQPGTALRTVPANEYIQSFDIGRVDWYYADAASVARWERNSADDYILLDVGFQEQPNGGFKVTYQKGVFADEGEGDSKALIRRYGPRAAYIFAPIGDCWQLIQHLK